MPLGGTDTGPFDPKHQKDLFDIFTKTPKSLSPQPTCFAGTLIHGTIDQYVSQQPSRRRLLS